MTGKGKTTHSADVGGAVRSLQETPTWALATVCFVFIAVSIVIERLIHLLSTRLKKNRKISLLEAVENLKSVLMVLGFMSLMINVIEVEVSKLCIPIKYANRLLPCHETKTLLDDDEDHDNFFHHCSKVLLVSLLK